MTLWFEELKKEKDACYRKVKASAKVWPSAYASGRLVQCRKKGADNWGNSKKKKKILLKYYQNSFKILLKYFKNIKVHSFLNQCCV